MLSNSRLVGIKFVSSSLKLRYCLALVATVLNMVPGYAQGRPGAAATGEGATIQIKTKSPDGQQGKGQWSGPRGYGNQDFKRQGGNVGGPGQGGRQKKAAGLDLSSLGLSEAQKQKITGLRSQNSGMAKELQQSVRQRKSELKDLMFSPEASNADIERKRVELFKLQEQHDKAVMNDFLSIRGVLTQEQLKMLPTIKPQRQQGVGKRPGGQGPGQNWQGQGRGPRGQDGFEPGDRQSGMPGQDPGMADDGPGMEGGMPVQGTAPGQGMEGRRMPGQGDMPGQGMEGRRMPGQGMQGRRMPGQGGMPGQGMGGQGQWNPEMEARRKRWRRQMQGGGQGEGGAGFGRRQFQEGQGQPGGMPGQNGQGFPNQN